MEHTSLSLIARACTGSENAWERLVTLYQPLIKRWLTQLAVDPSEAEDIGQEVMATLLRELPKFEHNGRVGAFRCWLRTISVNQVRRSWRKGKLRPQQIGDEAFGRMMDQLEDPTSDITKRWTQQHDDHVVLTLLDLASRRFGEQSLRLFRRQVLDGVSGIVAAKEAGVDVAVAYAAKSRIMKHLRDEAGEILDESVLS